MSRLRHYEPLLQFRETMLTVHHDVNSHNTIFCVLEVASGIFIYQPNSYYKDRPSTATSTQKLTFNIIQGFAGNKPQIWMVLSHPDIYFSLG